VPFHPRITHIHRHKAFVAGFQMGRLDSDLAAGDTQPRLVYAHLADQADLIAMRHGYTVTLSPTDDATWAWLEVHA